MPNITQHNCLLYNSIAWVTILPNQFVNIVFIILNTDIGFKICFNVY